MSTATVLAGGHSNRGGGRPENYADSEFDGGGEASAGSEFDGGDEADTAYTGDGATHAESIIGETSDESEEWEYRNVGSPWSL